MLTSMRSQMKTILWILVFAFLATIVFSWGMGGFKGPESRGVLGRIDDDEIQFADFEQYVKLQVDRAARENPDQQDPEEVKRIREQAWDDYVERMLKNRDAERLGIEVTNREIAFIVQNYPPNEVQQAEIFQREGKFDPQAYLNFLRQPQAQEFLVGLEASVRGYLTEQKALFHVLQAVTVSEQEVRDEFNQRNAVGKLEFVAFIYKDIDIDTADINEDDLRRYYRMFPKRFSDYAQRRFAYVKFKLEPSRQDSAEALKEAREIMRELEAGADFAELAKQVSDDAGSASSGGDLGWFGRGRMVAQFEDAAFNAEVNELVGPVESKFGYHIIQLLGRRTGDNGQEEINARHILIKLEASPDTREDVYTQAYNFAQDVQEKGFEKAVALYNFPVDTTKPFSESGYITGLGRMRMAAEFCFDNPVGTTSGVFQVPDGYVVFKIVEAKEDGVKPYEAVRGTIQKSLIDIAQQNRAWTRAADFRATVNDPNELALKAEAAGLKVYVTDDSLRPSGSLPEGLKRDADFLTEAFRLEEGEISDVIKGKNGCYVARMVAKSPFDEATYRAAHSTLYNSIRERKQEAVMRNWVRELRVAADIQDMRYRYYQDF